MSAEPWSKWFWTDYEADPGLRMSSLAAQGLWMRMLCLMAKASPKGELRVGSEPCTLADLAVYVGQSEETVAALVEELERRGVFSRTRAGVIYNRRLRKDADISRKRAKAGAKGAASTNLKYKENPDLPQQNSSKGSGKSPAPEARSQKLEEEEDKSSPSIADGYAFDGRTVRLKRADFDQWEATFHGILDLRAELTSIDAWWQDQPPEKRKGWFIPTSNMLNRKHQERLAAAQNGGDGALDLLIAQAGRYRK